MSKLTTAPPYSAIEPVTEVLHGVTITDPYRWLEDQDSPRTREWLAAQREYARSYLDAIPGRDRIRKRIRELLDVETCDSIQKAGQRYFFRKRLPGQEQPCIYFREGPEGTDRLLIDPAERGSGPYTAVKPLRVSPDGRLLLYEVKQGGERTGTFELLDIADRRVLSDSLPRGFLRGFVFTADSLSFYYSHEPVTSPPSCIRAVYRHVIGTSLDSDSIIFLAGDEQTMRLNIIAGRNCLGFLVGRHSDKSYTDFYLWQIGSGRVPELLIKNAGYRFAPFLMPDGRLLAITDRDAPNSRIVEVHPRPSSEPEFVDVIPAADVPIQFVALTKDRILVSYVREVRTHVALFDHFGTHIGALPMDECGTVRPVGSSVDQDELFFERESFIQPIQIYRYSSQYCGLERWAERSVPLNPSAFRQAQLRFPARDGTSIPMFLLGQPESFENVPRPTIMTSYGGYGVPMTPQFSVFVTLLMQLGCLFALPCIRGGSEFGVEWHEAAKRQHRQVAFDDFIRAAEWLIERGYTEPQKLAIFGASNSGLLVAAATTQRPDLFRAVICMAPMLDMLRYHLFDGAYVWKDEFGTVDDPGDFAALVNYSPYHRVRPGVFYPATMIVSGDADQNCNPLHARKMTARLQAANISDRAIFLEYRPQRGHSPVLPVSDRIDGLTERVAFFCDQLQLQV